MEAYKNPKFMYVSLESFILCVVLLSTLVNCFMSLLFTNSKHQVYETATLAAANVPASFRDMQQQNPVVMGTTGGGVKIKHVAHNKPTLATDGAESALPATASW